MSPAAAQTASPSPNAMEIARRYWHVVPDWVEALAQESLRTSQAKAAGRIGRSPAVVSQVLRNRYTGDMGCVEARVRGAFMNGKIDCPVFGEMSLLKCREWQALARENSPSLHNPARVMMADACPKCPTFQQGEK